jgi:hypothetical protein
MGAVNVEIRLNKKATTKEIKAAFENQKANDISDSETDGFKDIQSVNCNHLDKIYPNFNEAQEYCLDNAKKWEYAIAVYYTNSKNEINTLICGWAAT